MTMMIKEALFISDFDFCANLVVADIYSKEVFMNEAKVLMNA
ncbi:hypothetical protein [uncultured Muribaculum sp.]|nr:hypothetical protein [uncultured Muribaculum sp.]